jgi:hypothetical protein
MNVAMTVMDNLKGDRSIADFRQRVPFGDCIPGIRDAEAHQRLYLMSFLVPRGKTISVLAGSISFNDV